MLCITIIFKDFSGIMRTQCLVSWCVVSLLLIFMVTKERRSMTTTFLQEPLLIKEIEEVAQESGVSTTNFIMQAIRRHLAYYRQKRLIAETKAWYNLPAIERQRYNGQFVAVYNKQVMDSDSDRLALFHRIRQQFGQKTVLITEGGNAPIPVYRLRSPKRGHNDQQL